MPASYRISCLPSGVADTMGVVYGMWFMSSVVREWHHLCAGFYEVLLESCLDDGKRLELYLKMNRHLAKLADTSAVHVQG